MAYKYPYSIIPRKKFNSILILIKLNLLNFLNKHKDFFMRIVLLGYIIVLMTPYTND